MSDDRRTLAIALFGELLAAEQSMRGRLSRAMPKGMEISHFAVLNNLAYHGGERTPAELAETFRVTRGAMTNTLGKLEWAGYVHIRPDWEDARRKLVAISPAGRAAHEEAVSALAPMITKVVEDIGEDKARAALPLLREIRRRLV